MRNSENNVMKTVKVNRDELLDIVRGNKEKHITDYNESVEDYKKAVVILSNSNLKLAKSGDLNKISKIERIPAAPVSYENSYTRAIRMLELSIDPVIELEENIFNQLVLDEWSWKSSFQVSGSLYKSLTSPQ